MTDSVVGLLPTGAPAWSSGTVIALEGSHVVADLQDPSGRSYRVGFDLTIGNGGSNTPPPICLPRLNTQKTPPVFLSPLRAL